MNTVRAKFKVTQITEYEGGGVEVVLRPAGYYDSQKSEENKSFWEATPSGECKMTIDGSKTEAINMFEVGSFYYLDFTKATE